MAKRSSNKEEESLSNDPIAALISGPDPEEDGDEFPDGFVLMVSNIRWFGSWFVPGDYTITGKSYSIDRYGKSQVDARDVEKILQIEAEVFCKIQNAIIKVCPVAVTN